MICYQNTIITASELSKYETSSDGELAGWLPGHHRVNHTDEAGGEAWEQRKSLIMSRDSTSNRRWLPFLVSPEVLPVSPLQRWLPGQVSPRQTLVIWSGVSPTALVTWSGVSLTTLVTWSGLSLTTLPTWLGVSLMTLVTWSGETTTTLVTWSGETTTTLVTWSGESPAALVIWPSHQVSS